MKIKDLERTANVAWSPANQNSIYLASGTAAQQLDASFNTNAVLEIYTLNLADLSLDLELKSSTSSEGRFHKIVWGSFGDQSGTIVGGCDGGIIQIYNAAKLLRGEPGLVSKQDKHTGPVHALDFNPFQSNLLATGSIESEIYIWDMNNTTTPMTPGIKSQPFEDVLSIAWNRQVQHILASTFSSKCVVWDLRKNEPIIKLTDTVSRIRWKVVEWHPEVATQLCLASEEDQSPIIQLWDLRFATSPLKTLENHQRGVLSIAWCSQDSDLLVSCGKDNRIICWNPNSNHPGGEVLSEVAHTNQWNFDVTWCPKNPALIASPCFDGHVSIYSVMGGKTQQIQTTNKIADSFPGMDGYLQAPVPQQNVAPVVSVDLTKPPKWLKRPVGATFGFGGKLICFENDKNAATQIQQNLQPGQQAVPVNRTVYISQVTTEQELINKSLELEQALECGNFIDYCFNKAQLTNDQHKKYIWHFIKANFEENPKAELLNLLGYKIEDVNMKLHEIVKDSKLDTLRDEFSNINKPSDFNSISGDSFANLTQQIQETKSIPPYQIKTGTDTEGLIAQAILLGNLEAAVELCFQSKRFADAIIIAMTGGPDLLAKTQYKYLEQSEGYVSSLINALVSEDWASVINNCDINSWKEALCAAITHSPEEEFPRLCEMLGNRLEQEGCNNKTHLQEAELCYICSGNFEKLVGFWSGKAHTSILELQELVELVMFLQKAFERQGKKIEITGKLADLLTNYAFILASQGNLQTALQYLGNSQDEKVATLRDRLYVSLGQKPLYNQIQSRKNSARSSFSSYPNQYPQTNQFNQANFNQFNSGPPSANIQSSWQTQATFNAAVPKSFSPAPPFQPPISTLPPTHPPRPTSVGSAHGGSGLPSRTKYVVDPSVQSNQYSSRNMYTSNTMVPPTQPVPVLNPATFQTNALSNPSLSNSYSTPAFPNQFNQIPFNAAMAPNLPENILSPIPTQFNPPPIQSQPKFQNDIQTATSAMNTLPYNAAPGWNDPPAFHKRNRNQIKIEVAKQEPITHPLYGATPAPSNGYVDQGAFGQAPLNTQAFQLPPPTSSFNVSGFNTNPISQANFNQNNMNSNFNQPQPIQGRVETPQPIQKPPIPEEHVHMQTVFDELKQKCSYAANNPQTKRKIEDVSKKLESLYDLLRELKLSPNTLAMLHQMVQLIQNGDYMGGLNLHTQLVSGPDFAQIASFMPGLKVLLQSALQLQVYLR